MTDKRVSDFVNAVSSEDYSKAAKAFSSALSTKISAALDAKRIEVAGQIVNKIK
jgi:hypothetical protein